MALPLDDFLKHNSKAKHHCLLMKNLEYLRKALRRKDLAAVLSFNPGLTEVLTITAPEPFLCYQLQY